METSNQLLPEILIYGKLLKAIEISGIEKVDKILTDASTVEIKFNNERIGIVVKQVAECFGIAVNEIVLGSGRKNDRRFAIGFAAYYLKEKFGFDYDEIALNLKKHETIMIRYAKDIRQLNPRNKSDKKYLLIKETLDENFSNL